MKNLVPGIVWKFSKFSNEGNSYHGEQQKFLDNICFLEQIFYRKQNSENSRWVPLINNKL